MKNPNEKTSDRDDHEDDLDDFVDSTTDVIWKWLTLVVTKICRMVRKARRKRE
jgi:hypothetical protein